MTLLPLCRVRFLKHEKQSKMLLFNTCVAGLQLRQEKQIHLWQIQTEAGPHCLSPPTTAVSCRWCFLNIAPDSENKTQPFTTWNQPTIPSASVSAQSLQILNSHYSNFKPSTERFLLCPVSPDIRFLLPTVLSTDPLPHGPRGPTTPTFVPCGLRIFTLSH